MRNILIIFACVCFISVNCLSDEECRKKCNVLHNDYENTPFYGFNIDGVCHCTRPIGTIEIDNDPNKGCEEACNKLHPYGGKTYPQINALPNNRTQCICYGIIECTHSYCEHFCEYDEKHFEHHYSRGYCHEGYTCQCALTSHTECQSFNSDCHDKTETYDEELYRIKNNKNGFDRSLVDRSLVPDNWEWPNWKWPDWKWPEFDEDLNIDMGNSKICLNVCECPSFPIINNQITCGNGSDPTPPPPPPPPPPSKCKTCECNCTLKEECKNCFACYSMGFNTTGVNPCERNKECVDCLDCVYNCKKPSELEMGGCSVMCYTIKEKEFSPVVYNKEYPKKPQKLQKPQKLPKLPKQLSRRQRYTG